MKKEGKKTTYLREALHGSNKKNDIFNKVRDPHPELPEVVRVLWDPLLSGEKCSDFIY